MIVDAALVLEGGSLRSLYTAGVLDYFLEKNLEFACVIGVSAGAIVGASYISKQKRRIAKINIFRSIDSNYYGLKQLIKNKNAFNFDYLFGNPINELYPYDIEMFASSKQKFYICSTNCCTGEASYFRGDKSYNKLSLLLRASSSLPLLANKVEVNGCFYLDGGITEPIGLRKAIAENYKKIVVVLTRERDYLPLEDNYFIQQLFKKKYKDYPLLINKLCNINIRYKELKHIVNLKEKSGDICVIAPSSSVSIKMLEKNARKLINVYFMGLKDAERMYPKVIKYVKKDDEL